MNALEASKIKVGDLVTLYTYEELEKLGLTENTDPKTFYDLDTRAYDINTPINVIPAMMSSLGKTLKVTHVGPYSDYPISDDWRDGPGFYVKLADDLHAGEYDDDPDSDYYYDMQLIKEIAGQDKTPEFPPLQVKPGEIAILWSKEDMIKQYGVDKFGDIETPVDIVGEMVENLGTEVVVDEVKPYQDYSSFIKEEGYCFTIKGDEMGYWYDMKCVKGVKKAPEKEDIPDEKEEEPDMFDVVKKVMKYMTDAFEKWNEPTTGDKINAVMWLVHQGYMDSDRGAEMITKIIEKEG